MKKRIDRLEAENKTLHADMDRQRVAVSSVNELFGHRGNAPVSQ